MFSRSLLSKVISRYRSREIFRNLLLSSPYQASVKHCHTSAAQMNNQMKYILVTGGVISGVGKGVIASSFGTLLNCCGISVTSLKIDPYINIDAGTFSPYEHGKILCINILCRVVMANSREWYCSQIKSCFWCEP